MNRALKKYRRHVKRRLRCVGQTKRALLEQLDRDLARYAEEEPSASYSDAVLAIGAPMEVAAKLNETLTEQDEARYRHRKWWLRGAAAVVFILMAGYIGFLWKELSTPIVFEDELVIYEENPETDGVNYTDLETIDLSLTESTTSVKHNP